LLSGGIYDDISFEEDFVKKYNCKCLAFDGYVYKFPIKKTGNIAFLSTNIDSYNSPESLEHFKKKCINNSCNYLRNPDIENNDGNYCCRSCQRNGTHGPLCSKKSILKISNLHDLIDSHENIFIKMDIEGSEIPWFKSLSDKQINKFDQMVIEFHRPFSDNEIEVFEKINKNHVLVHFHGNNCNEIHEHKGVKIPEVFECTYLHKKFFTNPPELNTDLIPSVIDMKNNKRREDIFIDYAPFVHNVPF